jgi:hypothetical protein
VIPTADERQELARKRQGNLAEVPFPALLAALALEERTVVVELERRQLHKSVTFEFGQVVDARSNLAHETLGRYLVTEGKIKEEDFTPSLALSASRGVPLGEILVEKQLLTHEELFRSLQQNLAKKLLDLFTWTDGEYRLVFDSPETGSPLKVIAPQLLLTGVTKFSPQSQVDLAVGALVGKPLGIHADGPVALAGLKLTAAQTAVTRALEKVRRIDELATETALPFPEITRALWALALLGIAAPADRLPKRPRPKPTPIETGRNPVAVPPPTEHGSRLDPIERDLLRNRVVQEYLSYRRQDPFDLLELPEEAALPLIERRFLFYCRTHAPWEFEGPELGDLAEKARDLFLAGVRAYSQLANAQERATLLARRRTLREERKSQPPSMVIKTDLLDSELQFKKGLQLKAAGRYPEALLQLEFAADCDPGNSLYRAELAHCRYLAQPDVNAKTSLGELREAIRIDANCGLAHYYLGEIERLENHPTAAEEAYRKAMRLMAPDRRPIEGLKALKVKVG